MATYITPQDLAALIKSHGKVQVVDVRDQVGRVCWPGAELDCGPPLPLSKHLQDYQGLHIKGARNLPLVDWDEDTPAQLLGSLTPDADRVVLHCALSQVRGPKAARK